MEQRAPLPSEEGFKEYEYARKDRLCALSVWQGVVKIRPSQTHKRKLVKEKRTCKKGGFLNATLQHD